MSPPHVTHFVKILTYVSQRNVTARDSGRTLFHADEEHEPLEPLGDLVDRLDEYIRCSESCYAAALVYIDRITRACPDLTLNTKTVHKLLVTSLLLANQFLDDVAERSLQFANVAGYAPKAMVELKTDFLFRIRFHLVLSSSEICSYSDKLQGRLSSAHFALMEHWDGLPTSPHGEDNIDSQESSTQVQFDQKRRRFRNTKLSRKALTRSASNIERNERLRNLVFRSVSFGNSLPCKRQFEQITECY